MIALVAVESDQIGRQAARFDAGDFAKPACVTLTVANSRRVTAKIPQPEKRLLHWHAVPIEEGEELAQIVVGHPGLSNMKVQRIPGALELHHARYATDPVEERRFVSLGEVVDALAGKNRHKASLMRAVYMQR
jgi:hypothetical protein